jgi:hypothetical protein
VVGDEIDFGVGYGALVRAMTSPFVTKIERLVRPVAPKVTQVPTPIQDSTRRSVPDADIGGDLPGNPNGGGGDHARPHAGHHAARSSRSPS